MSDMGYDILVGALLLSVVMGLFCPSPQTLSDWLTDEFIKAVFVVCGTLVLAGLVGWLMLGSMDSAILLCGAGEMVFMLLVWACAGRHRDDGHGDWGGGWGGPPDDPPSDPPSGGPWDWEEFDRARERWAPSRTIAG